MKLVRIFKASVKKLFLWWAWYGESVRRFVEVHLHKAIMIVIFVCCIFEVRMSKSRITYNVIYSHT